jgi:hypothetical protein
MRSVSDGHLKLLIIQPNSLIFGVKITLSEGGAIDKNLIDELIQAHKPAHAGYRLEVL